MGEIGFDRQGVHVVQVGLGTFATFMQNLAGRHDEWDPLIGWLLESITESRPECIRAVAVEPVAEHVRRLRQRFCDTATFRHVELLQVALGEQSGLGEMPHVFTEEAYIETLRRIPRQQQKAAAHHLTYLRNMSCVGAHPHFEFCRGCFLDEFGIDVNYSMEAIPIEIWTYRQLVQRLKFKGAQLLIVDAEGYDTAILRSVIDYCFEQQGKGSWEWPDVICYEAQGHCDKKDGVRAEAAILESLQEVGYSALLLGGGTATLVHYLAYRWRQWLRNWVANHMHCTDCGRIDCWPFTMERGGKLYCAWCWRSHIW